MTKTASPKDAIKLSLIEAKSQKIGVLTLDSPETLNSQTLDMVRTLSKALKDWEDHEDIALVVLQGAGEKAFCAGGDIQKLYHCATENPGGPCPYAEDFFLEEYQLIHQIHSYRKPILCIGHGYVMGGGVGLMAGASHRVACADIQISMPEISIGLFPDVGGTWFLNKMPYGLGMFFGLTGARINAPDALLTNMADYVMNREQADQLISALSKFKWSSEEAENHKKLDKVLSEKSLSAKEIKEQIPSELNAHQGYIENACLEASLGEFIQALKAYETDSIWYKKALKALEDGSPLSSLLIYEQLKRNRYASLETIIEKELVLAINIIRYPEFSEGVRARLIDKDQAPKWQYAHFGSVPSSLVEHFFTPLWETSPMALTPV